MTSPAKPAHPRFQFSLRQAFLAMSGLCVVLGIYASYGMEGIGVLLFFHPLIITGYAIYQRWEAIAWPAGAVQIAFLICALIPFPAEQGPRRSHRPECMNNERQTALAITSHQIRTSSFPSRVFKSKVGEPLFSWRALILPDIGQQGLWEQFDPKQAWNSPKNLTVSNERIRLYRCPQSSSAKNTDTNFVAIAGPATCWPDDKRIHISDITDGVSNTILFVEQENSGIHWAEPRDLDANTMSWQVNSGQGPSISSRHGPSVTNFDGSRRLKSRAGANVAMADGSIRFLPNNTDPEVIKRLVNRHDGKPVGDY